LEIIISFKEEEEKRILLVILKTVYFVRVLKHIV